MVLADDDAVQEHRLSPLVRIIGWHVVGCDPNIMGFGPVPAIRGLLEKTGIPLEKIDLIEVKLIKFFFAEIQKI